ncbi:MAG TPA: hypothetical protein VFJ14_01570 [Nocardioidaceae bacterium]|nr:hypothetical protein [Nocardioidaceae bacterium]
MTTNEPPPEDTPLEGQSESVGPPVRDDAPPKRGPQPFVWLAVIGIVVLATAVLLFALAGGVL